MESIIAHRLSTLGHPNRLAIFRLLMRRHPGGVTAGEIAAVLGLKPSTLSAYLSALLQSGMVTQTREGTSLRYGVDLAETQTTMNYLVNDCCRGRPDMCLPGWTIPPSSLAQAPSPSKGLDPMSQAATDAFNVLFICTGNSARSIFAEVLLRDEGQGRFHVFSAGTKPYSELNPFALAVLRDKGHEIADLRAKNVSEFQGAEAPKLDFVFTVCDRAANEECPPWPGQPISAHWGLPDPVRAEGTDAQKSHAFQQAYGALLNRVRAFAALPFDTLDRIGLQKAVDALAKDTTSA